MPRKPASLFKSAIFGETLSRVCQHSTREPSLPRSLLLFSSCSVTGSVSTLYVFHVFLYISLPSMHDYDVKMPNFTFFGGRKQATTNFSFSF